MSREILAQLEELNALFVGFLEDRSSPLADFGRGVCVALADNIAKLNKLSSDDAPSEVLLQLHTQFGLLIGLLRASMRTIDGLEERITVLEARLDDRVCH